MKNLLIFCCVTVFALMLGACSNQTEELDENPTADYAMELIIADGMTCHTMQVLLNLNASETDLFTQQIRALYKPEVLTALIDSREKNCGLLPQGGVETTLGTKTQTITSSYQVEFIEETSGSSGNSGSIYRDSSSSSWMCNSGSPKNPADYIGQYYVSGAYSNRSDLRIRGTNWWASCYIQPSNATRVYSDDDMRVCIGYWHVFFCGAGVPVAGETKVWR